MTIDHRHSRFLGTLFVSAAVSCTVGYVLLRPLPGVARGPEPAGHDAVAKDVAVDAKLAKTEQGWSIELKAVNSAATARKCKMTASLRRTRSSPMSRVAPMPQIVWTSEIAVTVPAHGEWPERVAIPANLAKDITPPEPVVSPMDTRVHFGVQVQASCAGGAPGQAS